MRFLFYIVCAVFIYKIVTFEPFQTLNVSQRVMNDISSYPDKSLDIFTDKLFKPECCPSYYTKSSGCMCDDPVNHNILVMRGGNRMLKDTYAKTSKVPYLTEPICPPCDSSG
jgi:hypothetical protein